MAKSIIQFLVLVDVFAVLAMASEMSPSPSPAIVLLKESSTLNRKMGLHQLVEQGFRNVQDRRSPSPAPQHDEGSTYLTKEGESDHTSGEATSVESMDTAAFNLQTKEIHLKHHHSSVDKSVAGGAVILGGLVVVFLGAVFCYIKATGRQKQDLASSAA
ncbi:uncharacterized protein LOC116192589 [Punica granatum]|uniref:Uncharacterized protein LOC116192589 n=1 Tax=Punica granatum TaxID=22663 RepID=A0A218X9Z8_PUNGR|nr:uncharacterized protein LOC116192589 [Punica granatum]OWM81777.1 hypothetical protein CDL15_Pgr007815 [Punica granatum]